MTAAYDVKAGVAGDNINTSEGAKVISIVISPYNALIYNGEALPPIIPNIAGWYNYPD
jgi:hypothetical protein